MVDFIEIEKTAYLNNPLPTYHTQSEQLAYLSMRELFIGYQKRNMGKDQARKERESIKLAYEVAMLEEIKVFDIFKRTNESNVKLAGLSRLVESGSCERCKTIMRIWDGRLK